MYDDDLKTSDALDQTSAPQAGQSEQASDKAQDASQEQASGSKKVNLQEFPEFKDFQSKTDKQISELGRRAEAAERREADVRKRAEALEDATYGKDDYGKMQLFAQRQAQEAETLRQELTSIKAARETDNAKSNTLKEIADAFEVPVSVLADATDPKHAVLLARTERDRRIEVRLKDKTETRTANKPDLGGGARSTATTRLDSEYDDAAKRGDSVAMARLLREIRAKK